MQQTLRNRKQDKTMVKIFAFVVLVAFLSPSCFGGNRQNSQPTAPDYKNWDVMAKEIPCRLDGKNIVLWFNFYTDPTDPSPLYGVVEIADENGEPWLLIYGRRKEGGDDPNITFFEFKNSKWVLVKNFGNFQSYDKEGTDFLNKKYKLELFTR